MRNHHPRSPDNKTQRLYVGQHSRALYSPSHQPFLNSPRSIGELRPHQPSSRDALTEMRLMKSKMEHEGGYSQFGRSSGQLFPPELLFLLGNEEGNVEHFRKLIENEKGRVYRDFDTLLQQISHILNDLKISLTAELDLIFKDFLTQYGELKTRVANLRQNRRRILENHPSNEYYNKNQYKTFPQNQTKANNISNINFLQEASRDEEYMRNHQLYEEITQAHIEALVPILAIGRNIIILGSEEQFYQQEKGAEVIKKLRNGFFDSTKEIFESQLDQIVTSSNQILRKNNEVLNGISQSNIDPRKSSYQDSLNRKSGWKTGRDKDQRAGSQVRQYDLPVFKQSHPRNQAEFSQQKNRSRPYSSSEHLKLNGRHEGFKLSPRKEIIYHQKQQKIQGHKKKAFRMRVARNQQSIVSESFDEQIKLIKNDQNPVIACSHAKAAILCALFVNEGKAIAVGCRDTNIYVYQASTGNLFSKLEGHKANICTLANFGDFFASGGDSGCCSLILWDLSQYRLRNKAKLHNAAVTCITDLLDGVHLATAGYDKQIIVYNYLRGEVAFDVSSNKSSVASMALCHQSRKLVSGGLDLTLSIWSVCIRDSQVDDIKLDKIVTNCGLVSVLRPLTLVSDLVIAGNQHGKLLFINLHSGEIAKTMTVGRNTVLELLVFQIKSKPTFQGLLSFCSHEKELLFTKTDSGASQVCRTQNPIQILHGCGVGPMMAVNNSGLLATVSQLEKDKTVRLYKIAGLY